MQPAEDLARRLAAAPQGWDVLPLPALELSSDAQALQANAAMAALAGLSPAALLGTGWFAVLSPDRRPALFQALADQRDFELEIRLLRHDRVKAHVVVSARWLPQSGSFLCLLQDHTALQQAVEDAQALSSRFSLLADNVPVLIAYYESAGFTCLYANRQYATTFGLQPEQVVGRTFAQVIGDAAAAEIQPRVDEMLTLRRTVSYVRSLPAPGGRTRWIEVSLVPHLASDGHPFGSFVLINDITRHREAEAAVRESEERMAKFMAASVEGIVFHRDGLITDLNEPMIRMVGGTREQLLGRHVLDFISPGELARVQQVMSQGTELSYETEIVDLQGHVLPVEFIVRTLVRGSEKLRMTIVRDIRDRQAAQARIRQLAHTDALTGLHNRASFVERLEAELAHPSLPGQAALLFIDLDHFKRINDSLGHLAGDAVLRAAGARITAVLPPQAAAGRFGGDEFVILLPGQPGRDAVARLAARIAAAVQAPVAFGGRQLVVTPTVGIALFPEDAADADALLRHADAALYAGKAAGRHTISFFEAPMAAAIDAGLQLETELATALRRGEFRLLARRWSGPAAAVDGSVPLLQLQPLWQHPQTGPRAAGQFADAALSPRLLQPLLEWVLGEALALRQRWCEAGRAAPRLQLDLAALAVGPSALASLLAGHLPPDGAAAGLQVVLGERTCAEELPALPRVLAQLAQQGVGLVVGGLGGAPGGAPGTGGLPLAQLAELPLAGWCLDHTLVARLPGDPTATALAQALIGLGRALGRPLLAEGTGSDAQRRWLAAAGCMHWLDLDAPEER